MYLFCCALLYVLSSCAIILKRKRELVALLLLSFGCLVTVNILWLFFTVTWVGLQYVIVVFADHTYLLFVHNATGTLNIYFIPQAKISALRSKTFRPNGIVGSVLYQ